MNRQSYRSLLKRLKIGIIFSVFVILLVVSSNIGEVTASAYLPITATPKISISPTVPVGVSVTPTPIAPISVTVTTSPDYLLDALTAAYVLLTLSLAVIAFRSLSKTQTSLQLTREQIDINKQQSQEAIAASERHSQAALEAVQKQIDASERQSKAAIDAIYDQIIASEKQSQATIETVNRQIAASESQAKEALHNQHRPVLVPVGGLGNIIDTSGGKPHIKWGNQNQEIDGLQNIGVGPAFSIYGILFGPPFLNSQPPRERYIVWNYPALTPGVAGDKITLQQGTNISSDTMIEGYTLYVPDDGDHVGVVARFTLTYHDVFGRKYASIHDYHSQIGWISRGHFSDIEHDIYELDQQTPGTKQTNQFFYDAGKRAQSC